MKNRLGCLRIKSLAQRDTMRFLLHNMLHVVNEKITRYTGISSLSSSIVSLIGDSLVTTFAEFLSSQA